VRRMGLLKVVRRMGLLIYLTADSSDDSDSSTKLEKVPLPPPPRFKPLTYEELLQVCDL
jgi:hypothetical protein